MTLQEAEKILQLSKEYSEQDIIKNYRTLLHFYHPDNQNTLSKNEKTKEIINARDFLLCRKIEIKEFL